MIHELDCMIQRPDLPDNQLLSGRKRGVATSTYASARPKIEWSIESEITIVHNSFRVLATMAGAHVVKLTFGYEFWITDCYFVFLFCGETSILCCFGDT